MEISSYITSTDAVIAFSNLNSRFQDLLTELCHTFDFSSISKKNFDTIFQYQNTNRWHSLKLSDDEHTRGQVKYFFENHSLTDKFSQLQSLSIVKMKTNSPYPLFSQLPSLSNLVSLEIESICGENIPEFELPNLKKLIFGSCPNTNWLKNFAQLDTIEYTITDRCTKDKLLAWPETLKYLKIIYQDHRDCSLIQNSLVNLSLLIDLEIYQKTPDGPFPRGETWEQIITTSIPPLKNFKFYFQFICHDRNLNELKQIVTSFSTPFYVLENNWFIRCDVSAYYEMPIHDYKYGTYNTNMRHVILYTIPVSSEVFTVFKTFSKTKISDWSRNYIDHPSINIHTNMKTLIFKSSSTPDPMFDRSSIINVIINTSFDAQPWLHMLTKLRHITIGDGTVLSLEDFTILLDNAPHLSSLTGKKSALKLLTDNWTDICICHRLSRKIRSLTFTSDRNSSQNFDKNELERILPIFSSQCQHLSLGVHSHKNIIDFILRKMCHLISLHVHSQRDNCPPITIEWLEQQNTRFNRTNCIITNVRRDYYFWLG
ncbi:unnamed protein product [Adineta steineri]|uniref:Uncharacterized protein n=2 Tax=Adineta steineri TaxID=433720 RepID=A0A815ZPY2_9BILA|nr:unnamed protein product [Adineta steineri]